MLIFHKNCVAYDNLSEKDLELVQDPAMSHDEGRCWFEIADGDESLQRSLGDSFTWAEILEGDYSSGSDVIVAPEELRSDIEPSLKSLGFIRQNSYYSGEDRFYFEGNRANFGRGRSVGFSPINGAGKAMRQKQLKISLPASDMEWLEAQPNQSETIRNAIALLRQHDPTPQFFV